MGQHLGRQVSLFRPHGLWLWGSMVLGTGVPCMPLTKRKTLEVSEIPEPKPQLKVIYVHKWECWHLSNIADLTLFYWQSDIFLWWIVPNVTYYWIRCHVCQRIAWKPKPKDRLFMQWTIIVFLCNWLHVQTQILNFRLDKRFLFHQKMWFHLLWEDVQLQETYFFIETALGLKIFMHL